MWEIVYEDTDKRIERNEDGNERTTWTNPEAVGAQLADLQARVARLENVS